MKCKECKWAIIFPKGTIDIATGKPSEYDEIYCCELNKIFPVTKPPFQTCVHFRKRKARLKEILGES